MTNHGRFIWYELLTADAEAAKAFYEEVVGWSIGGPGNEGYYHLKAPDGDFVGGMMQLTHEMEQHGARPVWLGYLHVGDVDATVASITAEGGQVRMPAMDMANVGRMAMVTDPQGAPFYVMTPIPPPDQPDAQSRAFSPDSVGHCGWNELVTTDQAGALRFYARHFGMSSTDKMPMGEMGDYCFIDHDGARLGAVTTAQGGRPSLWNYYFRVDDIDRAQSAVESGRGRVMTGPMQVPTGDWIIQGADPQGAFFCLVGARKG
ncbi:MAG: VOC family protein [Novosphingobium sp.]|nr:VOC family protein [Novosphingobium sp.]